MGKFSKQKLLGLLDKAELAGKQLEELGKVFKEYQEHGGTATLYLHTQNHVETRISLDEDTITSLFSTLHCGYRDVIRRSKEEVDKLYEEL